MCTNFLNKLNSQTRCLKVKNVMYFEMEGVLKFDQSKHTHRASMHER
jgi:hypothetical protein